MTLTPEHSAAPPASYAGASPPHWKPYDVFISYRRSGGSELAQLVYRALQARGYRVFLDVREMPAGSFDQTLIRILAQAKDVVVLLSEGCLDRVRAEDWFREEIIRALAGSASVVPLKTNDFVFPSAESLPPEMRPLLMRHAVGYSHELSDASLDSLCKRLRSRRQRTGKPALLIAAVILTVLAGSFAAWRHFAARPPESGSAAPTPPVVASAPRLGAYYLREGARVPLRPGEPPLATGAELILEPVSAPGKSLYLLEITGQGHAELYDQQQLDKVHWGWSIDGPPASETLLLLSTDHPLSDAERLNLTESINRLNLSPKVAEQTEVLWENGVTRTVVSTVPGRGPKDVVNSDWQQQVLQVLKGANGITCNGLSVAVKAKS
jgi:hypothetical protein